jgi:hypothetical protein
MCHRARSVPRSTVKDGGGAARSWLARSAAVLVTALLFLRAGSAHAAPPSNDLSSGATPASTGLGELLDTTEATTDAEDDQLNVFCGAPATDASVWYAFTPSTNGGVIVDVSRSDYSAGVLIGTGTPGDLDLVTCGPGTVGLAATAGVTYYVLAIDDQLDGGGNGGNLEISITEAPPPPTIDLAVDRFGYVDVRTGVARLHGTYTCTGGSFIDLSGSARQNVGRLVTIWGFFGFFDAGTCDGLPHEWWADVRPENGKFAGGQSLAVAFAFTCGSFECRDSYQEQMVQLRGGGD